MLKLLLLLPLINCHKIIDFAIKLCEDASNLIYQRFEYHNKYRYQFFLGSANMPHYAWDILKYKIASKMVARNSTFLMIFGGTSVTAGHDNYYYQAYPYVFERRVRNVFETLGIHLEIKNIATNSNNCRPSHLCYEAQGGYNADWIGWEHSYNCGRDRGALELIARVAYWNRAVVHYSASGAPGPKECPPSTDKIPWISEEWTPEKEGITSRHKPSHNDTLNLRSLLHRWYEDGNSVVRFTGSLGPDYKVVGPHGFSVWSSSRSMCYNDYSNKTGCNAWEMRGRCHKDGGPHWMVKEAGTFAEGFQGVSWHPPMGMHLLRGEVLAYNFLNILLDAIYTVKSDLRRSERKELQRDYQRRLQELQGQPLPPALHCRQECETRPICYTNTEPHFGKPQHSLDTVIVAKSAGWTLIDIDNQKLVTINGKSRGYMDVKHCYETRTNGAEISVRVAVGRAQQVRLCGTVKDSLKHAEILVDYNATSSLSSLLSSPITPTPRISYVPSSNRVKVPKRKYIKDECTALSGLPPGNHVVSVIHRSSQAPTCLSHVISFE